MRQPIIATSLTAILIAGQQALAADQLQQAQAAESKAKVLERSAATGGGEEPTPQATITKQESKAVDPVGIKPLDDAITCLSRAIYWESKGEDAASMEAVANVVMNRLAMEGFPKTICGVVREGGEQGSCQFSWWCDGRADEVEEENSYARAIEIARKAINLQLTDRTDGALYFHHGPATADWSAQYIRTVEIGQFSFYKPHNGKAK